MFEPDAPEQGQCARDLAAMRKEVQDRVELHFAIGEFEHASNLLEGYIELLEPFVVSAPDPDRSCTETAENETAASEHFLLMQEIFFVLQRRAGVLIDLIRKRTEPKLRRTRA